MIAPYSPKVHPEFDLVEAGRIFKEAGAAEDIEGELITSPHDLFSVEMLRDRHGLRIGRQLPTDVFVFAKGDSPRRDGTKVGGVPYWPSDRPWPTTPEGAPYLFLAQFNFADSRDLFADLPSDVLLLLVDDADEWFWDPERIRFEWLPLGLPVCAEFDQSVIAEKAGPFYGVVYRSADYPEAQDRAGALTVSQSYNLPILNGTKIGGLPHRIQPADNWSGEFLCQLGSIQAAPNVPYPWANQGDPLGLEFDNGGIYSDENCAVFGDMGTLYIFRDRDGSLRGSFECY